MNECRLKKIRMPTRSVKCVNVRLASLHPRLDASRQDELPRVRLPGGHEGHEIEEGEGDEHEVAAEESPDRPGGGEEGHDGAEGQRVDRGGNQHEAQYLVGSECMMSCSSGPC